MIHDRISGIISTSNIRYRVLFNMVAVKMTESLIRKALACIDHEQWKPVRNGDKIRVKGERFMAEVTGAVYDAEALASYLSAVSPENIAALLVEMDELRKAAGDYKLSEDIRHSLVKLAYRVNMDMVQKERVNDKSKFET